MNQPYEILLRWKDDGTFSGGHTIRRDPATGALTTALPIGNDKDFKWPDILGEVNAALGAQAGKVDEITKERDTAVKERDAAVDALNKLDPEIKIAALKERQAAILAHAAQLDSEIKKLAIKT